MNTTIIRRWINAADGLAHAQKRQGRTDRRRFAMFAYAIDVLQPEYDAEVSRQNAATLTDLFGLFRDAFKPTRADGVNEAKNPAA